MARESVKKVWGIISLAEVIFAETLRKFGPSFRCLTTQEFKSDMLHDREKAPRKRREGNIMSGSIFL